MDVDGSIDDLSKSQRQVYATELDIANQYSDVNESIKPIWLIDILGTPK